MTYPFADYLTLKRKVKARQGLSLVLVTITKAEIHMPAHNHESRTQVDTNSIIIEPEKT